MIGNDLIDLSAASLESNWERKRYLEKTFSIKERSFILEQSDPNLFVWLFWSMKEASYKIIHRSTKIRTYNPWKYECSLVLQNKNHIEGNVKFENKIFHLKSEINDQFIHSIAVEQLNEVQRMQIHQSYNYLNKASFLSNCLSEDEVFLKDQYGIPYIGNKKNDNKKMATLSHHGKGIALVVLG